MTLPNGNYFVTPGARPLPTTFPNANMYIFNNTPVLAHEPSNLIGLFNVGDFLDPSYFGDQALRNRLTCHTMDAAYANNSLMLYGGGGFGGFVNIV